MLGIKKINDGSITYSNGFISATTTIKSFISNMLYKQLVTQDKQKLGQHILLTKTDGVEAYTDMLGDWAYCTTEDMRILPFLRMTIVCIFLMSIAISVGNRIAIFHTTQTLGVLIFPLSYLILNTISENYGYHNARKTIWISAFSLLVIAAWLKLIFLFYNNMNISYQIIEHIPGRIVSNVVGIVCADLVTALLFSALKTHCEDCKLWLRSMLSNTVGQLVYVGVSWPFIYGISTVNYHSLILMVQNYLFTLVYCIALVPFLYLFTFALRRFSRSQFLGIQKTLQVQAS